MTNKPKDSKGLHKFIGTWSSDEIVESLVNSGHAQRKEIEHLKSELKYRDERIEELREENAGLLAKLLKKEVKDG